MWDRHAAAHTGRSELFALEYRIRDELGAQLERSCRTLGKLLQQPKLVGRTNIEKKIL